MYFVYRLYELILVCQAHHSWQGGESGLTSEFGGVEVLGLPVAVSAFFRGLTGVFTWHKQGGGIQA